MGAGSRVAAQTERAKLAAANNLPVKQVQAIAVNAYSTAGPGSVGAGVGPAAPGGETS